MVCYRKDKYNNNIIFSINKYVFFTIYEYKLLIILMTITFFYKFYT